jgi:YggT family protein
MLCNLLMLLLIARGLLSFVVMSGGNRGNPSLIRIYGILVQLTEPLVAPCRRLISRYNTGMFDFSLWIAMLLVMLVRNLLLRFLP